MDNQQPLQSIPPAQNKWWPINRKRNKAIKIINLLTLSVFIVHILSDLALTTVNFLQKCPSGIVCGTSGLQKPDPFYLFINLLSLISYAIFFLLSLASIIFSIINLKSLDRFDKLFFWTIIILFLGSVCVYGFIILQARHIF